MYATLQLQLCDLVDFVVWISSKSMRTAKLSDYDTQNHRLMKIADRTLDVVLSRFIRISFIITLRQKPKGVTHSRHGADSLSVLKFYRESEFNTGYE